MICPARKEQAVCTRTIRSANLATSSPFLPFGEGDLYTMGVCLALYNLCRYGSSRIEDTKSALEGGVPLADAFESDDPSCTAAILDSASRMVC